MITVNIHEAKTNFSRLVDAAMHGEEIVIAKAGKPAAKLIPFVAVKPLRTPGLLKGKIRISDDFDAPLSHDILDQFEGKKMNLLLDTHIFLWWLQNSTRLGKKTRCLIVDADAVYVSSVSIWEITIKIGLGKLKAETTDLVEGILLSGFLELPFTARHAAGVVNLPDYHRDPFDRALISQSIAEPLRLLTLDATLIQYSPLVQMIE